MNNLKLQVTVPSLSVLTPVGANLYQMVVKVFNSTGGPLNNPNINNSSTITVNTTSTTFDVNVPVIDGNWSANDVVIKVFSNDSASCCFAIEEYDIVNTQSNQPGQNTLEIVAYFSQ